VQIETIYYGANWGTNAALQTEANQIDTFLNKITDSTWMDILSQYSVTSPTAYTIGHGSLLGRDPNNPAIPTTTTPVGLNNDDDGDGDGTGDTDSDLNLDQQHVANVMESDIQNMIVSEVGNKGVPATTANTLYFVFIQPGALSQFDTQNSFGGHHRSFTNGGNTYYYAVIPLSLATAPTGSFQQTFPGITSVASHELAEAITDPILNTGWDQGNSAGAEIGDLCNGMNQNYHGYNVQELYSNAAFPAQNTAANACIIEVDKPLDSVVVNAPSTAIENQATGTFTVATFHDQDSTYRLSGMAGDFTANLTWGDGVTGTGTVIDNGSGNFSVQANHNYGEEGSYTLKVEIDDAGGSTISSSTSITVTDPAVVGTGATVTAVESAPFTGKALATFTDPAGPEPNSVDTKGTVSDHYKVDSIDWGDGTALDKASGTVSLAASTFTVAGNHTYGEEGTYTITAVVDHEGVLTTVTATATVSDPAVVATAVPVFAVECRTNTVTLATFTDPGGPEPNAFDPGPLANHYKIDSIDWGDSTPLDTSSGAITFDGVSTFTVMGTHAYQHEGVYTVTVVIDHEGVLTTVKTTATIKDDIGLLLLDATGNQSLQVNGNGIVNVTGCGAAVVDSSNSTAALISGHGSVTAEDIDVTGGVKTTDHGTLSTVVDHESATADPLGLGLPAPPSPSRSAFVYTGSTPMMLNPGTYVGGITISGTGPVTLNPGVYYMMGGGFSVSGQATVTGSNVLIVNAPAGPGDVISVSSQAHVTLSALTTGPDKGVVMLQDPASTNPVTFSGQSAVISLTGVVYVPGALVQISGNANVTINPGPGTAVAPPPILGALIAFDLHVGTNGVLTVNPDDPPASAAAASFNVSGSTPVLTFMLAPKPATPVAGSAVQPVTATASPVVATPLALTWYFVTPGSAPQASSSTAVSLLAAGSASGQDPLALL
jgi:hypothetical protein